MMRGNIAPVSLARRFPAWRWFGSLLGLLAVSCTAAAPRKSEPPVGITVTGKLWVGVMVPYENPTEAFCYALDLRGKQPTEWSLEQSDEQKYGIWQPGYIGRYTLIMHGANGVLFTLQHDKQDGDWVETRVASFTWLDAHSLLVVWNRVVNNVNETLQARDSKFGMAGKGILKLDEAGDLARSECFATPQ